MSFEEKEYILYCDESVRDGPYYSNFYGGVLVPASCWAQVSARLDAIKVELHLHGEVKWQKVTENYLGKYRALIDEFFSELAAGNARVRIMFRQNSRTPKGLTGRHIAQGFYMLYYQFI